MDNQVGVDQISLSNHDDTNYLDSNGIIGVDDDSNLS